MKCEFPKCEKEIRKEDKELPEIFGKLCQEHYEMIERIGEVLSVMSSKT